MVPTSCHLPRWLLSTTKDFRQQLAAASFEYVRQQQGGDASWLQPDVTTSGQHAILDTASLERACISLG